MEWTLLDIFGLIFMIFAVIGIFLVSFYIYVHLSHSLDKEYNGSWFGRLLIVTGMSASYFIILLFEFDYLSNYKNKNIGFGFDFDAGVLWLPTIYFSAFLSLGQFFFIHYYRNAKEVSVAKKLLWASFVTFWPVLIYSAICFNYFLGKSFSRVKVNFQWIDPNDFMTSESNSALLTNPIKTKERVYVQIDFGLMLITPFIMICSFMFSFFGGAGMAYYPIGLIKAYLYRPKEITAEDLVFQKNALKEDSKKLIEKAKEVFDLKRDLILNQEIENTELKIKKKIISQTSTALISDVIAFEDAYYSYKSSTDFTNHNPLYYYGCLGIGVAGVIVSLAFFLDIVLSIMKVNVFMDNILNLIKRISPVYSFIFFFMVGIYVTIAVTKGSYKLSKMIFYVFQAFPIKANRTWTDAFLMNNIVVLMSIIGFLVMLSVTCPIYTSYLTFDLLKKSAMRSSFMILITKYKILRFIYIFSFLIAVFTSMIFHSSKDILAQSSDELKKDYNKKKADYQALNKDVK